MLRRTKADKERARLCSVPGCGRPWASTFRGRLCALHNDPPKPSTAEPLKPAAKAWSDPEKDDE